MSLELTNNIYNASVSNTTYQNNLHGDWLAQFSNFLDIQKSSVQTYQRALKQWFIFLQQHNISEPKSQHIVAFKQYLMCRLKPTTVQNYLMACRAFFKWTEQEALYKNITISIKGVKLNRAHKKDYLTSAQLKILLAAIDQNSILGKRDYAILLLMITGGLRNIEVSRLSLDNIRQRGGNTVLYVQGKGQHESTDFINLPERVSQAIWRYVYAVNEVNLQTALFISLSKQNYGKALTTRSISRLVKNYFLKNGFKSNKLSAHSLRHSAVTLSLQAGQSLASVQQFARHASITTTQIYNHALEQAHNACSQSISDLLF
jgi:integrase/recombinase XerC